MDSEIARQTPEVTMKQYNVTGMSCAACTAIE